jgi:GTPase SAR1 family protein
MEKTIAIRNTEITFSIWDLGGQREFVNMLPLVCNDAIAILFMFDLSRKSSLNSIKEWYRQARGFNKVNVHFTRPQYHSWLEQSMTILLHSLLPNKKKSLDRYLVGLPGSTLCKGNEGSTNILFNLAFY